MKVGPPAEAARALQPRVPGRTLVQVVCVNVGLTREVMWKGMTVQTGISKGPVDRPVTISNRRPQRRTERNRV